MPSPLRQTVIKLNRDYLSKINTNSSSSKITTVLDIGCGNWSFFKDGLKEEVEYHGLDVYETPLVTDLGSVGKLPFSDSYFDYVICNESMEHWFEYGVTLEKGLSEIHRVLKENGFAFINIPNLLHGNKFFVYHDFNRIFSKINFSGFKVSYKIFPSDGYFAWRDNFYQSKILAKNKCSKIIDIHLIKNGKRIEKERLKSLTWHAISRVIPGSVLVCLYYGPRYTIKQLEKLWKK